MERMPGGERQDLLIEYAYKDPARYVTLRALMRERAARRLRSTPSPGGPLFPASPVEFAILAIFVFVGTCLVTKFIHMMGW